MFTAGKIHPTFLKGSAVQTLHCHRESQKTPHGLKRGKVESPDPWNPEGGLAVGWLRSEQPGSRAASRSAAGPVLEQSTAWVRTPAQRSCQGCPEPGTQPGTPRWGPEGLRQRRDFTPRQQQAGTRGGVTKGKLSVHSPLTGVDVKEREKPPAQGLQSSMSFRAQNKY